MNISIISPDVNSTVEGSVIDALRHLNPVPHQESDVVVVPISRFHSFKFNPKLYTLKKPIILVDYVELGANDWDRRKTHFFGAGTLDEFSTFNDWGIDRNQWVAFDKWVEDNPPKLYLKRELLAKDVSGTVKPIDYVCNIPPQPKESLEEFLARPLDVFYTWGHSNEGRRRVHGEIFKQATGRYELISAWEHFAEFFKNPDPNGTSKVWASIFTPHFHRAGIGDVVKWSGKSKVSLSMPGAGIKCFRHSEVSSNSVMVLQNDPLAWSISWEHEHNCIRVAKNNPDKWEVIRGVEGDEEVATMWEYSQDPEGLYRIYLEGLKTVDRYRPQRYCHEYLRPLILHS